MTVAGGILALAACLLQPKLPQEEPPQQESEYVSSAVCLNSVGFGPLNLRTQSPFHILRLSLLPSSPSTLTKGAWEIGGVVTWTNRWAFSPGEVLVDMEAFRSSAIVRYGISHTMTLQLEVPHLWRGGGVMDSLIQNFHDIFGIDQNGRDLFDKDLFQVEFTLDSGETVRLDRSESNQGFTDMVLSFQHNLTCGTDLLPGVAWGVSIKFPVGEEDELLGTDGVDVGVYASISRRITSSLYFYLNFGFARFGEDTILGIELRENQWTGLLAFEWRVERNFSFLLQILENSGAAKDFGEFSRPTTEATIGAKWEVEPGVVLEFGLIENAFAFDNSPDFGIHVGFVARP